MTTPTPLELIAQAEELLTKATPERMRCGRKASEQLREKGMDCLLRKEPSGVFGDGYSNLYWALDYIESQNEHLPALLAAFRDVIDQNLGLRRRIHINENHNQFFERCESAWCQPVGTLVAGSDKGCGAKEAGIGYRDALQRMEAKNEESEKRLREVIEAGNGITGTIREDCEMDGAECDCRQCLLLAKWDALTGKSA